MSRMKALLKYAPGVGNVAIRDVPVREPGPDELLVKVKYCGICGTDLHIQADEFPNNPPLVMGHEYCGTVAQVGEGVRGWSVGDRAVGEVHRGACLECALCLAGKPHICDSKLAIGSRSNGAFAEYITIPAWIAHQIPEGVPWEVAGVTEPFAIGAHCLVERGKMGVERTVLITGAATIGLMSTIWARRLGAQEIIVSGTDIDATVRFPLARELGATLVVNVQREDLARVVGERTNGQGVDALVECSGAPAAIRGGIDLIAKTGKLVLVGLVGPETIPVPWNVLSYKEIDIIGCFSSPPSSWQKALAVEKEESANLRKLVTHIIPLEDWAEGFAMMSTGEAVKILIDMEA